MFNISKRIVNKALEYFVKQSKYNDTDTLIYDYMDKGKPYSIVVTIEED